MTSQPAGRGTPRPPVLLYLTRPGKTLPLRSPEVGSEPLLPEEDADQTPTWSNLADGNAMAAMRANYGSRVLMYGFARLTFGQLKINSRGDRLRCTAQSETHAAYCNSSSGRPARRRGRIY